MRDLASSFGAAAAAYAEHRPNCAPAAVRWALEHAPGPRVLDLGAGTGKLTRALGDDVIAVERTRQCWPSCVASFRTSVPLPECRSDPDCRTRPSMPCWTGTLCTGLTWPSRGRR
ncbi:hypothetical protein [Kibdelosporangium philippinense]|uniref:hypothetical protein n=1 Tax=Kibdelosporangium philippinense TaxID=211113 RepID=UPI0036139A18